MDIKNYSYTCAGGNAIQTFSEFMPQEVWDSIWNQNKTNLLNEGGWTWLEGNTEDEDKCKAQIEAWFELTMQAPNCYLHYVIVDDYPVILTVHSRLTTKFNLIDDELARLGIENFDYLDLNGMSGTCDIILQLTGNDKNGSKATCFSDKLTENGLEIFEDVKIKLGVERIVAPVINKDVKKFLVESGIRRYIGTYVDDGTTAIAYIGNTGWPFMFGKLGV